MKSFAGNNFSLDGLRNAAEIIFRLHYKICPLLTNILHGELFTAIFPRKNVWEVLKHAWFVVVPVQMNPVLNLFSQKWFNHGEDSMENDWLIYQMDPTNFQWKGICKYSSNLLGYRWGNLESMRNLPAFQVKYSFNSIALSFHLLYNELWCDQTYTKYIISCKNFWVPVCLKKKEEEKIATERWFSG